MRSLLAAIALAFALGPLAGAGAQQPPASAPLNVIPVQGSVHLISGAGVNITVQVGKYGVLLVDTPQPAAVPRVMEEIRKLSTLPLRWVINTSSSRDHVAGNAALVAPSAGRGAGGAPFGFVGLDRPSIVAHENVLNRLSNPPQGSAPTPPDGLPTTTYFQPTMDFSNGEAIVLYHQPAAHTDSDSVVLFRGSDVISTGAIFTPGRYPVIDVAQRRKRAGADLGADQRPRAGRSRGVRFGWNADRSWPRTNLRGKRRRRVPRHGRHHPRSRAGSDHEGDDVGQIKASRPSRDYDAEYGAIAADAERFVESIYRSLTQPQRGATVVTATHGRTIVAGLLVALAGAEAPAAYARMRRPQAPQPRVEAARGAPPPTPRASAPVDFTGNWVSVVSEDWRWRMITPPKGDYANIPLNAAGTKSRRRVGSRPRRGGRRTVPGIRRAGHHARADAPAHLVDGRLHAQDRNRRRHADARLQVRASRRSAERTPPARGGQRSWQGVSVARWEPPPQGGRGLSLGLAPRAGTQGRSLEVVTTQIRPGYLRKNGVPFSENASVTEYFDLFPEPDGPDWFVVTTSVRDPLYLGEPWVTTSHFKKEPDGSKWNPTPCQVR